MAKSIQKRIINNVLGISFCLVVTGAIGVFSLYETSIRHRVNTSQSLFASNSISDLRFYGSEACRLYLRATTPDEIASEITRLKGKFELEVSKYVEAAANLGKQRQVREEQALFKDTDEKWARFIELSREGLGLIGHPAANRRLDELNTSLVPKAKVAHNDALAKLIDYETRRSESLGAATENFARNCNIVALLNVIGGFAFSLWLGIRFARSLSKDLKKICQELAKSSSDVESATRSVFQTSESLSALAKQQAASLTETVSAMEELTAIVARNAENAMSSSGLATQSHDSAVKGETAVKDVMDTVVAITESSAGLKSRLEETAQKSGEIANVITEIGNKAQVINDIVFQTRLLSFNASVEAARAGEHGKGFSVVAEEVGKLARTSGTAADEISAILRASLVEVREGSLRSQAALIQATEQMHTKIQSVSRMSGGCGEALNQLVGNSEAVARLVAEIGRASQEQTDRIKAATRAIEDLKKVAYINESTAKNTSDAGGHLRSGSDRMRTALVDLESFIGA